MAGIPIPRDAIRSFCSRRRVGKLALLGSVLRPDFGPASAIDILVEFDPAARVGFFEVHGMEQELGRVFGGRKVDLNSANSLSKYLRQQALAEAHVAYVSA